MSEQVVAEQKYTVSSKSVAFKAKVLINSSDVKVGDCLIGITNDVLGEGYVIHLTVSEGEYDFLDSPLDLYEIVELLERVWQLADGEEVATISYIREIRDGQFYPWCDEAFFYRAVRNKALAIIGVEVSAQNNNDCILTWKPSIGWEINMNGDSELLAVISPVNRRNPLVLGQPVLNIINPDLQTHNHYTINSKYPLNEHIISAITGSILVASFATLENHLLSFGVVEASIACMDPESAESVKENGAMMLEITNPDLTIDYTAMPAELVQLHLH